MVFKIGIVGAGPAGSILARLLLQSKEDISVTIFESEGSLNFRSQGGSLDLHSKTGLAAIKKANLFDEFLKHARYDGEAMKIADKKLLCYIKQGPSTQSSGGRPEIDRPKLRELLYNSLPSGTVQWNKKLLSVARSSTPLESNDLTLTFADGTSQSGYDLVVGADGAWSKTRTFLTDAKPYYSGIGGHSFSIPEAAKTAPELYDLVSRGSVFTFSDGKSIMAQQMGDGSINIGTWAVRPTDWQKSYDVLDPEAVKEICRKEYADWDPLLVALTQKADNASIAPRDLFMLPIGQKWEHVPGITLIGDAAHVMTPFAGEGVNLAFEDALKLSEYILSAATASKPLDQAIVDFENDMFVRMKATQTMTYNMMNAMYYTPGAPRNGIETYVVTAVEGEMGPWLTQLVLRPIVYAWFAVFKMIW